MDAPVNCVVLSLKNENALIQIAKPKERDTYLIGGITVLSSHAIPNDEALCFATTKLAYGFIELAEMIGYEKAKRIFSVSVS